MEGQREKRREGKKGNLAGREKREGEWKEREAWKEGEKERKG